MLTTVSRKAVGGALLALLIVMVGAWGLVHRVAAGSSATENVGAPASRDRRASPSGARTVLPGLTPPTGEPMLAGLRTVRPDPGSILRLPGPFDDRIAWSGLRLDRRGVAGTVRITSDVSDVLELEVLAGFYDREGRLMGTRRFVRHTSLHDEAVGSHPNEAQKFTVAVPAAWRATAVSAAVGVPVLVNE